MTTSKKVSINVLLEQLQEIINNADNNDVRTRVELLAEVIDQLQDHMTDSKTGKGILTRLALLEQEIKNVQDWKNSQTALTSSEKTGKWQLRAAIATGAITGTISIVLHLLNIFHK